MYITPISRAYNTHSSAGNNDARKRAQSYVAVSDSFAKNNDRLTDTKDHHPKGSFSQNLVDLLKVTSIEERLQQLSTELTEVRGQLKQTFNNVAGLTVDIEIKSAQFLQNIKQQAKTKQLIAANLAAYRENAPIKNSKLQQYHQLSNTGVNSSFTVTV